MATNTHTDRDEQLEGCYVRTLQPRNHLERDERGNFLRTEDGGYVTTPEPVGSLARVTGRESHGANPWTRWTLKVQLADGRWVTSPGHTEFEILTFDEVEELGLDGTLR